MITEDYVGFETAKLLKEKGFDEPCTYLWIFEKTNNPEVDDNGVYKCPVKNILKVIIGTILLLNFLKKEDEYWNNNIDFFACPTLQMVMKWLREVHNLDIIAPPQFDNSKWTYSAIIFKLSIPCTEIRLNDNKDKKEDACESAIKYCLENLI